MKGHIVSAQLDEHGNLNGRVNGSNSIGWKSTPKCRPTATGEPPELQERKKQPRPCAGARRKSRPPVAGSTSIGAVNRMRIRYHNLSKLETKMDFADFELSAYDRAAPLDAQDLA